jgi:hypothetical protein
MAGLSAEGRSEESELRWACLGTIGHCTRDSYTCGRGIQVEVAGYRIGSGLNGWLEQNLSTSAPKRWHDYAGKAKDPHETWGRRNNRISAHV